MEQFEFGDGRLPDRFWVKVRINPETQCWEWQKNKDSRGYGRFWVSNDKKQRPAHVVSYKALIGPYADGLELDHRCRVRCCVNPAHTEPVTHQVNVERGEVGANKRAVTHCRQGHEYSPENTWRDKTGARHCRRCRYEAGRRHRAKETPQQREHRLAVQANYRKAKAA